MTKSIKFSHRSIEKLPIPEECGKSSGVEYTDLGQQGLKLSVYKSGHKFFRHRFTVGGKKVSMTIGEFPTMTVEQAREKVRQNRQKILEGEDPRHQSAVGITMQEFVDEFYAPFAQKQRKSWRDVENRLNKRVLPVFGSIPLRQIVKPQIVRFHLELQEVSGTTANRYLALISSIMNKAVEWGHLENNPARGIRKAKESGARTRVLSPDELGRFSKVLQAQIDQPQARAIFLLIVLGLRKMEVLSMRWEHVNLEQRILHLPDTKSGKPRDVVLNSSAVELLQVMFKKRTRKQQWVFSSNSKQGHLLEVRRTFSALLAEAKIENLRLHDLRRTFASNLVNAGVSVYEVRDLLGHSDVKTTQIYAHLATQKLQGASEVSAQIIGSAMGF